jgi:hypothetical protein
MHLEVLAMQHCVIYFLAGADFSQDSETSLKIDPPQLSMLCSGMVISRLREVGQRGEDEWPMVGVLRDGRQKAVG